VMTNAYLQLTLSITKPPSTGPRIVVMPDQEAHSPIALPRSSGG